MFHSLIATPPREITKWCGYVLLLLAPGSFVILPVLWLVRQVTLKSRSVAPGD